MPGTYKAFISYSHADEKWARWLHRKLEGYRIPRHLKGMAGASGTVPGKLSPIFRDRDELSSSHDLSSRIEEALLASDNLIVICSPSAAASRWVNQEIEFFQKSGKAQRIFCLIVDSGQGPEHSLLDCFPPAISDVYDETGNKLLTRSEPLAADLRKEADGRALAFLKIVSGLLEVPLDRLRQRELQRKQRQIAVVVIASLCAVSITTALAINAILARNQANLRQQQAEDLLGFMVGDLRDKLKPIGRLDVLEAVGQRAIDYFATVGVEDLSDGELLRHSEVLTQLGEISISELQYKKALSSFTQAYQRSAALQQADPNDGERLFNRAQAEFWIGYVHWRNGDLQKASTWLKNYRDSSLQLTQLDPQRDDWLLEVSYGYHNLAVLDVEAGNLDAAETGFSREAQVYEQLLQRDPEANYKSELADLSSWLGEIALQRGQMATALAYYVDSAGEARALALEAPKNTILLSGLADALINVADIASVAGNRILALQTSAESMDIFGNLLEIDSTNVEWRVRHARSALIQSELMATDGQWSAASVGLDDYIDLLESLSRNEVVERSISAILVNAYLLKSWLSEVSGDWQAARTSAEAAVAHAETELALETANHIVVGRVALSHITLGKILLETDAQTAAGKAFSRADDLLRDRVASTVLPWLLDPWARLQFHTNKKADALAAVSRLNSMGYQPIRQWPVEAPW
jgi:tetratricopeptide (TPR) repeat protein